MRSCRRIAPGPRTNPQNTAAKNTVFVIIPIQTGRIGTAGGVLLKRQVSALGWRQSGTGMDPLQLTVSLFHWPLTLPVNVQAGQPALRTRSSPSEGYLKK